MEHLMQAWQLSLEPKSEDMLRKHECAHECRNVKNILLAVIYVANVYVFFTEESIVLYKNP